MVREHPTPTPAPDTAQTEQTAAQQHADFLDAVAEHLRAHPHLAVPHLNMAGDLHVSSRPDTGVLVAWYRSLGVHSLQVDLFDDYAAVHAPRTPIGDRFTADVWGGVDGLQRLLVQGAGYGRMPFTLIELEHYAAHGTLPEAGEPR